MRVVTVAGGARVTASRKTVEEACADAVGREIVVDCPTGGRYRGEVSRCEPGDVVRGRRRYVVWVRRGEHVHGPFTVCDLPEGDE